jgi:predicted ATPase
VIGQHFKYFDLSQRGHGEAILIVKNFHFFDGKLFVGIFVFGEEDDAICALSDDISFLELANEAAVKGVHLIIN